MRIVTPAGAKLVVLGAALLLADPIVEQSEWTQWRGHGRDGSVSGDARTGEWPARPVMLWEREVGAGYSGPVVLGDRLWVHTRRGGREVVTSLTLSRGDTAWRADYDADFTQDPDGQAHGKGPFSTPSLADGRLFTLGVTSVLSAWDAETGDLLWRRDYSEEFDPNYQYFGTASSPLVWSGLCFVHFGGLDWQEHGDGAMVALDVTDGSEQWRWDGDTASVGASPVIRSIGGRRQMVFKTLENIVAVDPQSGEELWRIHYVVSQNNTIVTPLFLGDQLVTSDSDLGIHSWRIEASGESWSARKLWETRAASMYTSSPVVVGEQIVGFSHFRSGQLFGLDPTDGEVVWRGEPRSGEHATLVAWGNEVLVFLEDGSLVVGQVGRNGFRPLRTYRLGRSRLWAHPAVVGNRIIVKDGSRLVVFAVD